MPGSPPKRMTRSRAKAAETTTTAATRVEETWGEMAKGVEAVKSRGRGTKKEENGVRGAKATKAGNVESNTKTTAASRARAKAVTDDQSEKEQKKPVRATRGRPRKAPAEPEPTTDVPPQPTRAKPATRATRTTKKVTFEDANEDKENQEPVSARPTRGRKGKAESAEEKEEGKATGMRAKPVRRPATGRNTRTRAASAVENGQNGEKSSPLSPKKATQVATAPPHDEEGEEVARPQTPVQSRLAKSPIKPPASATPARQTPLRLSDVECHNELGDVSSPSKRHDMSVLASPARKPPPSPAKETPAEGMSLPPKRVNLPPPPPLSSVKRLQHEMPPPQSASKSSLVKYPSPFKASLLQSPARKMPASAAKKGLFSPTKSSLGKVEPLKAVEVAQSDAEEQKETPADIGTPVKVVEDPFVDAQIEETAVEESGTESKSDMESLAHEKHEEEVYLETVNASTQEQEAETLLDAVQSPGPQDQEPMDEMTPQPLPPSFTLSTPAARGHFDDSEESDSEDELQSSTVSFADEAGEGNQTGYNPVSPIKFTPKAQSIPQSETTVSMSPLARQLEAWKASSPNKSAQNNDNSGDRRLSQIPHPFFGLKAGQVKSAVPASPVSPAKQTFFEDEMSTSAQESGHESICFQAETGETPEATAVEVQSVVEHETPVDAPILEDRDETIAIDPLLLRQDQENQAPCTPVRPQKYLRPMEVKTTSKVPLKGDADSYPSERLVRRSASLSGLASSQGIKTPPPSLSRSSTVISYSPSKNSSSGVKDRSLSPRKTPSGRDDSPSKVRSARRVDSTAKDKRRSVSFETPVKAFSPEVPATIWSKLGTPARTPRADVNSRLLSGAVVYVDVHTTEGADASGIFVELLSQMGARCVKQWNWNPAGSRKSSGGGQPSDLLSSPGFGLGGSEEGIQGQLSPVGTPGKSGQSALSGNGKIGITHVVFKDGGKRTLERVRQSKGVVQCVGVGWVLDCEAANNWLDETPYLVDISVVPRGGHNRRKSMEPQALSNLNGVVSRSASTSPRDSLDGNYSEFLNLHTPVAASRSANEELETPGHSITSPALLKTPTTAYYRAHFDALAAEIEAEEQDMEEDIMEITTPQVATKPSMALLQQTCPPNKRSRVSVSPSKDLDAVRRRLVLAKRKSLQFAPKIGSPLSKHF